MKLNHYLTPYIKIHSKFIKDLHVSVTTIKLLGKNLGKNIPYTEINKDFLYMTSKNRQRIKVDHFGFHQNLKLMYGERRLSTVKIQS